MCDSREAVEGGHTQTSVYQERIMVANVSETNDSNALKHARFDDGKSL